MLRMTRATDYAIVLLTYFAGFSRSKILSAKDLAAQAHLPLPMVGKILKALGRAGLLESHRGMKGGYTLTRPPEGITVADIIAALEGPIAMTDCVGAKPTRCEIEGLCPAQTHWQRINETVRKALSGVSLAQLAAPAETGAFARPHTNGNSSGAAEGNRSVAAASDQGF